MRASDTRWIARGALRKKWVLAILFTFVAGLLGAGVSYAYDFSFKVVEKVSEYASFLPAKAQIVFYGASATVGLLGILYSIVVFVLGGAVDLGLKQFNINLVRRDAPANFGVLFSQLGRLLRALLLRFLLGLFILLWSLLLLIPGLVASYRYAMAPYVLAQNPGMGVLEAIDRSKQMMKGYKWQLFCLHLSFVGWVLLSVVTCGLGFLVLSPYIAASEAVFYLKVSGQIPMDATAA